MQKIQFLSGPLTRHFILLRYHHPVPSAARPDQRLQICCSVCWTRAPGTVPLEIAAVYLTFSLSPPTSDSPP